MSGSDQLRYLRADFGRIVNGRWWRNFGALFSPGFAAVAFYRLDRAAYLALGRGWPAARLALSPLLAVIRPWVGSCEIHYKADIGPGLLVLHPSLGVVVSGRAVVGSKLTLTGGNCLGMVDQSSDPLVIGSRVDFGANATVLGPLVMGDDVQVGAGAVVLADVPNGCTAVGVPARVVAASHLAQS
jgi:serine acetyltransferase